MTLLEHATRELELAGYTEGEKEAPAVKVIELIQTFADRRPSGGSAPYDIGAIVEEEKQKGTDSEVIRLFTDLAFYKPLIPLTGADSEWEKLPEEMFPVPTWQNIRCSHVFKDAEHAYDIEGRVFRDSNGALYTNSESCVDVTFPYMPGEPEIIDREDT